MAFPRTLVDFRAEILHNLRESMKSLVDSLERSQAQISYGLDDLETVNWIIPRIRKCHSDLEYLFHRMHPTSMVNMPKCLAISTYQFTTDNDGHVKFDCRHFIGLEDFYAYLPGLDDNGPLDGQRGVHLLFSPRRDLKSQLNDLSESIPILRTDDTIERLKKRTRFAADYFVTVKKGSRAKHGEISDSALIAALILVYAKNFIEGRELLELLTTFLPAPNDDFTPLLPDIYEDELHEPIADLRLKTIPPVLYTTLQPNHITPSFKQQLSTKTLRFPGGLPAVPGSFLDMDMRKPHGKLPYTKCKTALWGSFRRSTQNWVAIGVLADVKMLAKLGENLCKTLNAHDSGKKELALHWNQILPYLYAIAINDIRISLRFTMNQLELLGYQNTAVPTITFANTCAMFLNHLDYNRRLIGVLGKELPNFPIKWAIYPPMIPPPYWLCETEERLRITEREVFKSYEELRRIREMVTSQHTLSQARKATILTILASIFIPVSFVATFFGMNTQEINSSAWPLKYYFAAALPLALITIVVPLYFIDTVALLARTVKYTYSKLHRSNILWLCFREVFIALSLVFCIFVDATEQRTLNMDAEYFRNLGIIGFGLVFSSIFALYVTTRAFLFFQWLTKSKPDRSTILRKVWSSRLDIARFLLILSYYIWLFVFLYVEYPSYFIYYVVLFFHLRRERKIRKLA